MINKILATPNRNLALLWILSDINLRHMVRTCEKQKLENPRIMAHPSAGGPVQHHYGIYSQ